MTRRDFSSFVVRRLVVMALLLVVTSFAVFSLLYLAPGSAIDALLGTSPRTPQTIAALKHEYHLDTPFLNQYLYWARNAIELNFGKSEVSTLPVSYEIEHRLPNSIYLGLYAFVLTMVVGVGLGVLAALRARTNLDRGIVGGAIVCFSTPAFVSAVFTIYLFAIVVHWFPAYGEGSGFADRVWHLTLPALSLAGVASASVIKHTRAATLNVLDRDYITFARARGLLPSRVLVAYILRNALIPVVTISALVLTFLITGAVLVEVMFSLPGIGNSLVTSATAKDLPMVQGLAMLVAVAVMSANLIADALYYLVDPRIRFNVSKA